MTHEEFLKKWLWKKYEESPELGVQCVWGIKLYCKERWYPIKSFWWSAWNGWKTGCPFDDSWKRIEYKPWMFPKEGDIVFFSEKRCKYGHVVSANKICNKDVLRCVDSNGTGKHDPFTNRFYDYKSVAWWYQRK